MRSVKCLYYYIALLVAVLMAACAGDETPAEEPLPDGMGRIRIRIITPEENLSNTRAVNTTPWEAPDHDWEKLQTFRILVCNASGTIVDIINGSKQNTTVVSGILPAGQYHIYATANFDENGYTNATSDGFTVNSPILADTTIKLANGYSEQRIPMTGKLGSPVTVISGNETDAGTITVWRVMAKLEFAFTNSTLQPVMINGIEVEPINQATATGSGIYLFSKDNLSSENNLLPQYVSRDVNVQNATVTWALHDATLQRTGVVAAGGEGLFSQAQLSWGYKLEATGQVTADDGIKLHKFKSPEKVENRDEGEAIIFAVKPMNGLTFTPKKLSFTACRIDTNGGYFDVVEVSNGMAKDIDELQSITPNRYNGDNGNHVAPFTSSYEVNLTSEATTGIFCVKIYLKNLDRQYAFSDVVITGDLTNTEADAANRGEGVTLPYQALTDVGPVSYTPAASLREIASNGTRKFFFYVNETDATYTSTENQLSVRFKIQRKNGDTWYADEIRYGVTTPYTDGTAGGNGFNVIRRNDWIHIPIVLRDWQFRVEPLAFVPIAGYPATTVSSDGLTTTFSTGGPIILQPFAQKNSDGNWRDFSDPEVTFKSLTWKNSDGTNIYGTGKIMESGFDYDSTSGCIVGVLNNSLATGTYKTTVTVNVELGSGEAKYQQAFTFNVVLQKE